MTVIILCDSCRLSLPVGSFTVLTYPIHPTAHPRSGLAARSDEQFSDKIRTILKLYISVSYYDERNEIVVFEGHLLIFLKNKDLV